MKQFLETLSETPESGRTGAAVRKDFATTASKGSGPNTMVFQASTNAVDRHGDIVRQDGWDLTNFRKNPVILWSHQYDQPCIGRAVSLDTNSRGLVVEVEFAQTEFAQTVYKLCLDGFLKAVSVGFQVLSYEPNKEGGLTYTSQELLEISVCSIPSNAEALRLRALAGADATISEHDFKTLCEAAATILDEFTARIGGPTAEPEEEGLSEEDFLFLINEQRNG